MFMPVKYMVEIYKPNSADDIFAYFETSSPIVMNAGDLINPGLWPDSHAPMQILKVASVEHIIWENDNVVKHKTCVFTYPVEGSRETRFPS